MTQDNWIGARRWVWVIVLVIATFAGGWYAALPATAAPVGVANVPPGLVEGALFTVDAGSGRVPIGTLLFAVLEVRGDWVRATAFDNNRDTHWELWVNLRTVRQLVIHDPKILFPDRKKP